MSLRTLSVEVALDVRESALIILETEIYNGSYTLLYVAPEPYSKVLECTVFSNITMNAVEYTFALDPAVLPTTDIERMQARIHQARLKYNRTEQMKTIERYQKNNTSSHEFRFFWPDEGSASEVHETEESLRLTWPGEGARLQRRWRGRWEDVGHNDTGSGHTRPA